MYGVVEIVYDTVYDQPKVILKILTIDLDHVINFKNLLGQLFLKPIYLYFPLV